MKVGEKAPDFEARDQDGNSVRLSELLSSGPVALFFYPAAMTPGCTAQSCHLRDLKSEFEALGAHRVGVSHDSAEKQAEFAEQNSFDYPLLSDSDRGVAKKFGTKRLGMPWDKRTTFVIDTDSTVLEVVHDEVNMERHADRALEVLRERAS
ncbi:MAG: peroxiredoxin [Acidobacteria bacterium]|nr:MAG: peroxiredoxin [Acidobacteriota bacterium]